MYMAKSMESAGRNRTVSFFGNLIDEQTFMEKQLLDITDLQIRKEAKDLFQKVLQPFYEKMQTAYADLELRLQIQEKENANCEIVTFIKPRKEVDITDNFLQPMCMSDMQEKTVLLEHAWDKLHQQEMYELFQIYVDAPYDIVSELLQVERYFSVEIMTEYGQYTGKARVEKTQVYEEILLQLYEDFVANGIEWKTVNCPYMYKMLSVMLVETDCPHDEDVISIKVDFGRYREYVCYDYVPLWNVNKMQVTTSTYPKRNQLGTYYEHVIQDNRIKSGNTYLVHRPDDIYDIRVDKTTQELTVVCEERKPVEWCLWEITDCREQAWNEQVWRNGNDKKTMHIRTVAEAIRFAKEIQGSEEIELVEVTTQQPQNGKEVTTYQMDAFIPEQIRKTNDAPKLYFLWVLKQREDKWNQDMLSFMLSRFQLIYPEYQCVAYVKE